MATTRTRRQCKTLGAYIAQEESRPAAECFKLPSLDEVKTVHEGLSQSITARQGGKTQRQSGGAQVEEVGMELLDLLQAAIVQIVVNQYGRKVTPDLQQWGVEVVARTAKPALTGGHPPAPQP